MKYAAFISYRHGGIDEKIAIQLQKEIERYRLPKKIAQLQGRKTLGKVFRDVEELKAASNLSEIIRASLRESEWLIVVCTRRYQESVWCMEEIEYFMELRGRDKIIVVLAEGEPEESFPDILTQIERDGQIVQIEPLAVDVRAEDEKQIKKNIHGERFRILANLLDLDYDDLKQRQRERKRRQVAVVTGLVIAGLGVFGSFVTYKNFQLSSAYEALDESMQQSLRGQSYYLSEYAEEAYANGDRSTAVLLALEALPENLSQPERPFVENVMYSLTRALGIYDCSEGYQADAVLSLEEEAYDTKVQVSKDRKRILVETYIYAANNNLERMAYVYSLQDRQLLASYKLAEMSKSDYSESTRGAWLLEDNNTLLYLGEDGLQAVDIDKKGNLFSGEGGTELLVSPSEDLFAVADYMEGHLYLYDSKGEALLNCDLGTEANYMLDCISPDGSTLVLSATTEEADGLVLMDTKTGESSFVFQGGPCTQVSFLDEDKLCFIRADREADIKHVVRYVISKGSESYLCDADWNLQSICHTGHSSCVYYNGNKIYEISTRTGKRLWKESFTSDIVSVVSQDNVIAVTCRDGVTYFYDSESQTLINKVEGNEEIWYLLSVDEKYACLRDYWGKNIRIYERRNNSFSSGREEEIAVGTIPSAVKEAPDRWYACSSQGENFFMGFQNGKEGVLTQFSSEDLSEKKSSSLKDLGYDSFENLTIDGENEDYFSVRDYNYYQNSHYDSGTWDETLQFDEDTYYYYNDDWSRLFLSEKQEIVEYEAATGKELERYAIPDGYDRGVCVGDYMVYGSDDKILIQGEDIQDISLEDAELYTFMEYRSLVFYRNKKGDRWYVYSLAEQKNVCEGEAGSYSCTMFFGGGRYFLNDYSQVYDMDSWEMVLDLSGISNGVYGVQTTADIPYFIVWYQDSDSSGNSRGGGANIAYLYGKDGNGEIVGVVPNYVSMAPDGKVIVYDGNDTLYKMPLYSVEEIVEAAKTYVAEMELSEQQKEMYHLFSE